MASDRWLTQEQLDAARLVLVVDPDGLYEWTATDAEAAARDLERVAADIRASQA